MKGERRYMDDWASIGALQTDYMERILKVLDLCAESIVVFDYVGIGDNVHNTYSYIANSLCGEYLYTVGFNGSSEKAIASDSRNIEWNGIYLLRRVLIDKIREKYPLMRIVWIGGCYADGDRLCAWDKNLEYISVFDFIP